MKVYLVREEWDNLEEYDCHQYSSQIIAVCATREKAKEFIKNFTPKPSFTVWYDDPKPTMTDEEVEENDTPNMPQRKVYIKGDEYHEDEFIYYIDEMEVLE